jgi:hypothetical protein
VILKKIRYEASLPPMSACAEAAKNTTKKKLLVIYVGKICLMQAIRTWSMNVPFAAIFTVRDAGKKRRERCTRWTKKRTCIEHRYPYRATMFMIIKHKLSMIMSKNLENYIWTENVR